MTLEIKQDNVQRSLAERNWRESHLTVRRESYAKQRNPVSNTISKAKKDYLCQSSRELFHLSSQTMGQSEDTVLPSNISPRVSP